MTGTAVNGREALAAVSDGKWDLILMDIQMPEMDGIEATVELRKRGVDLPIVALTANALAGEAERTRQAGMDDYLTKPIQPKALYASIGKLVRKRQVAVTEEVVVAPVLEAASVKWLDPATGLEYAGGDEGLYRVMLEAFQDEYEAFSPEFCGMWIRGTGWPPPGWPTPSRGGPEASGQAGFRNRPGFSKWGARRKTLRHSGRRNRH